MIKTEKEQGKQRGRARREEGKCGKERRRVDGRKGNGEETGLERDVKRG